MSELRRILIRRDSATQWETLNPALHQGEIGLDLTNKRMKVGDGFNNWNDLDYIDEAGLNSIRAEYGNEITFNINYDLHRN